MLLKWSVRPRVRAFYYCNTLVFVLFAVFVWTNRQRQIVMLTMLVLMLQCNNSNLYSLQSAT